MFAKIRDLWKKAIGYINSYVPKGNAKPSMKVVYGYAIGFLILFCVVLAAWIIEFCRGSANTMTLIKFFEDYTAVPVVGAIAFIAKYMVDKNRNGRPDAVEKELKKDDTKRN
ncbi:hypothetical protein [Dialister invisus]|uniref:hypothetical protein n=1 Tax=Dialister invisus TaxID=218538 RepID=UPI003FD75458